MSPENQVIVQRHVLNDVSNALRAYNKILGYECVTNQSAYENTIETIATIDTSTLSLIGHIVKSGILEVFPHLVLEESALNEETIGECIVISHLVTDYMEFLPIACIDAVPFAILGHQYSWFHDKVVAKIGEMDLYPGIKVSQPQLAEFRLSELNKRLFLRGLKYASTIIDQMFSNNPMVAKLITNHILLLQTAGKMSCIVSLGTEPQLKYHALCNILAEEIINRQDHDKIVFKELFDVNANTLKQDVIKLIKEKGCNPKHIRFD